jgi:hypothetical protein
LSAGREQGWRSFVNSLPTDSIYYYERMNLSPISEPGLGIYPRRTGRRTTCRRECSKGGGKKARVFAGQDREDQRGEGTAVTDSGFGRFG